MTYITEKEVSERYGVHRQTLREWRLGRKKGKYEYPPVLQEGTHWQHIGRAVVYTDEGVDAVKRRASPG